MIKKTIKKCIDWWKLDDPSAVKQRQIGFLIFIILIILFIVFSALSFTDKPHLPESKKTISQVAPSENHLDAAELWVMEAQEKVSKLDKTFENYLNKLNKLIEENQGFHVEQQEQIKMIHELQERLQRLSEEALGNVNKKVEMGNQLNFPNISREEIKERGIENHIIELRDAKNVFLSGEKNPENYVPVGSFVKAVLLSGLLAATSVTGQANPRPVLLRILDQGILPNHTRSQLKDCFITGAGIGDISSERAYIRLESLSCTKENNRIIEFPVYGTVVGPDGRDGIFGRVIWADQKLIKNGFNAGLLSGLSKGVSERFVTTNFMPGGGIQSLAPDKVLQYGGANAVNTAGEKLADYYLKRADQYQPVIEIDAGTVVDVVFLKKGFYLKEKKTS